MKSKVTNFVKSDYVRLAFLSATAAALAYFIAGIFPDYINAAVAGLTALISIRPTFHDSAAEGMRQVLGTFLGAGLGLLLTLYMGYSPLMIFLMILACFAVAKLLRLGSEGAAVIGLTVIIVVGPFFDVEMVESRFYGVLLGSVIALIFSLWVLPGKPHMRALHETDVYVKKASAILNEVSKYLMTNDGIVDKKIAKAWVLKAEKNMEKIAVAKREAESALKASRWSPLVKKKEAEEVLEQIIISQVTVRTTYNIVRDLYVSAKKKHALPAGVAESIAGLLNATAKAINEQSSNAMNSPSEGLLDSDSKIIDVNRQQEETSQSVKKLDETQSIMIAGSLMRDAEKIKDALTQGND